MRPPENEQGLDSRPDPAEALAKGRRQSYTARLATFEIRRAKRLRILEAYPSLSVPGPRWAERVIQFGKHRVGVHRFTGRLITLDGELIFDPLEDRP